MKFTYHNCGIYIHSFDRLGNDIPVLCMCFLQNPHNRDTCDSVCFHSSTLPYPKVIRLAKGIFFPTIAYIYNTTDVVFFQEGFLTSSIFFLGTCRTYLFSTTGGVSLPFGLAINPAEVINNRIASGSNTKIKA